MDLDLPELHARALQATRKIIAGLGTEQWDARVETANTTVRTLVNHVVGENFEVEPLVAGQSKEQVRARAQRDALGDDPLAAYDRSAASAAAAFRAPGALETLCQAGATGASMSGAAYCGNRFVDVLVHGWEIAKVTGQDTRLDPALAESARTVIEPDIRMLRENGVIRAELEVPTDADSQTHLLALFGFRS